MKNLKFLPQRKADIENSSSVSLLVTIKARHWLSGLAVTDFRFFATLGMTVRWGRIVAGNPFYIPLSAPPPRFSCGDPTREMSGGSADRPVPEQSR